MKKPLPMIAQVVMLDITPTNSFEAYNKLCALNYLDEMENPHHNDFIIRKPSKRHERILKMYWTFKKMESTNV